MSAAEGLATVHESPLVPVLTSAFRAMLLTDPSLAEDACRDVAADLARAGMPGVEAGLLPLALLSLRLRHRRPAPADPSLDWGPYRPWV